MTPTPSGNTSDNAIGGLSPDAFSSLFQSVNGLRNRRALFAMLGCMVIGVLVAGFFSLLASRIGFVMALLGFVAMFVASATGISAAGVLLMEQARGVPLRPLKDAVIGGLMCIPRFIGLALTLFLVAVAVFSVLAVVFFVCKVPLLGPILFVAVFPLSVVIVGLALCGLFLCMFLALPAIWEGATIARAITQVLAIARTRLVEAILLLAVVGLLAGVVGFIVFGVLFSGLVPAVGLSAAVLGGDGPGALLGAMQPRGEDFGGIGGGTAAGTGYAIAAGIGAGLLWALAGSLVSLVYLLGLNIVYLRLTEGLDVGATEAALNARLDDARRGAAELGQNARQAAERARDQARQVAATVRAGAASAAAAVSRPPEPPPAPAPRAATTPTPTPRSAPHDSTTPAVAKALTCQQCLSAVGRDDMFCGVCGYRLK